MNMNQAPHKIAAVIPAYNESDHIEQVVAKVKRFLPTIVIDDGSTDNTAEIAESSGAAVLRQSPNQGKGAALTAGFRYALGNNYQAILTLDADGQHNPDEIPRFITTYRENQSNLIIGQRDFSQMPPLRRLANSLGRWTFSWAIGATIPDNQSGYRLIDRAMMQAMIGSQEQGFEFEVEMIVTCVLQGLSLAWVPIQTIYAGEASHINNYQHTINFLRLLWRTWKRRYSSQNKTA